MGMSCHCHLSLSYSCNSDPETSIETSHTHSSSSLPLLLCPFLSTLSWFVSLPGLTVNRCAQWCRVSQATGKVSRNLYKIDQAFPIFLVQVQKNSWEKRHLIILTSSLKSCTPSWSADFSLLKLPLLIINCLLTSPHTRSFCTKVDALTTLDDAYKSAVPRLYTNEPRQFHVRVPCRPGRFSSKAHQCTGPATIVFRVSVELVKRTCNISYEKYKRLIFHNQFKI